MSLTIYHNPRCSKSRQTLKLIEEAGVDVDIVLYLEDLLSENAISSLLQKLGFSSARQLIRRSETVYKELNLKAEQDEAKLISAMSAHPKLIERPIVVKGDKAILGRPPENVSQFL